MTQQNKQPAIGDVVSIPGAGECRSEMCVFTVSNIEDHGDGVSAMVGQCHMCDRWICTKGQEDDFEKKALN